MSHETVATPEFENIKPVFEAIQLPNVPGPSLPKIPANQNMSTPIPPKVTLGFRILAVLAILPASTFFASFLAQTLVRDEGSIGDALAIIIRMFMVGVMVTAAICVLLINLSKWASRHRRRTRIIVFCTLALEIILLAFYTFQYAGQIIKSEAILSSIEQKPHYIPAGFKFSGRYVETPKDAVITVDPFRIDGDQKGLIRESINYIYRKGEVGYRVSEFIPLPFDPSNECTSTLAYSIRPYSKTFVCKKIGKTNAGEDIYGAGDHYSHGTYTEVYLKHEAGLYVITPLLVLNLEKELGSTELIKILDSLKPATQADKNDIHKWLTPHLQIQIINFLQQRGEKTKMEAVRTLF